jgi:hypothetical protein
MALQELWSPFAVTPKLTKKGFSWLACLIVATLILQIPGNAIAQGDGPRSQLLLPIGVNLVVPTYIHLSGNYNFADNILIQDADISSDIYVLSYTRAFSLAGHYAQIFVNPIYGSIDGHGTVLNPTTHLPITLKANESGFADPLISFKYGLIGTPALEVQEFAKLVQEFQLSAFASVSVPIGDYNSDKNLNLGTNVWALRLGTPMVLPFGVSGRQTFLEFFPSVAFYEDNNDPTGGARRREQDPLFMIENHLSYNFIPELWGSIDLRYRYGGETTTDGVSDDNKQDVLGGGVSMGYAFTRFFSMQATYGTVLNESDGSDLDMIRVKLALLF